MNPKISVLIADDHTIVRDGLRLILESTGEVRVIAEAKNGKEAVQYFRKYNPDVILMDIGMPEMNGISATEAIHAENPSAHIIMLSMQSSLEDIYRALKAGAIGYLMKESAASEVVDAIKAASQGKRFLSRQVDDILIDGYIHQRSTSKDMSPLESLSPREREVLQLVAEGKSSNEIGTSLFLSVKTVETYRSRLMQKLGLKDIPALVKFAIQHGLTSF
jgi:DNA-binding NarL/FixJ family response regulator